MNEITIRFVQLLLLEVAGIVLCFVGARMALRSASGKGTLLIEGAGIKAKIVNASPGAMVLVVGALLAWWSLRGSVEKETKEVEIATESIVLEEWLKRSESARPGMSYKERLDLVVQNQNLQVVNHRVDQPTSFESAAALYYGHLRFWPLLAAANGDRSEFRGGEVKGSTIIQKNSLIEVWRPSRRPVGEVRTLTRIADNGSERAFYEMVLEIATTGVRPWDDESWLRLDEFCKAQELGGVHWRKERVTEELRSLADLSLKYYGEKRFWQILAWMNAAALPRGIDGESALPLGADIQVLFVIPR